MREHVKILGIIHIVFGCLGVLGGIAMLGVFGFGGAMVGMAARNDPDAAAALPFIGVIGLGMAVIFLVFSVPEIVAGWGLLQIKPWARLLTIVLSAFQLLNIPIGTALGIYGLWVMLNQETERMFGKGGSYPPPQPVP